MRSWAIGVLADVRIICVFHTYVRTCNVNRGYRLRFKFLLWRKEGHVYEKGTILSYISALEGLGIYHFLKNSVEGYGAASLRALLSRLDRINIPTFSGPVST